jgi:hypothetical protein
VTIFVLDAARSRIRIHTYAEGLLARLAHDLAIEHADLRGRATREGGAEADVEVSLAGFTVLGVLHGERIDAQALSPSERREILGKMRREVFHADDGVIRIRVEAPGEPASACVVVIPPSAAAVTVSVRPDVEDAADGGLRVRGTTALSLAALGAATVKGPMGAFKVKDVVDVRFDLVFVPEGRSPDGPTAPAPQPA